MAQLINTKNTHTNTNTPGVLIDNYMYYIHYYHMWMSSAFLMLLPYVSALLFGFAGIYIWKQKAREAAQAEAQKRQLVRIKQLDEELRNAQIHANMLSIPNDLVEVIIEFLKYDELSNF